MTTTEYDDGDAGRRASPIRSGWKLTSGRVLDGAPVKRATGHPTRPLAEAQIYDKFADCLDAGHSDIPAATLFARLKGLEGIAARELARV